MQGHRIELGEMKLMVYTVMGAKDDLQVRAVDISKDSLLKFQLYAFSQLNNHLTVI